MRWCGTAPRWADDGLAVAMSIPRYTLMESAETISTSPRLWATANATSDFPDAVVPTRTTGRPWAVRSWGVVSGC
jgi:hypothetical protein